MRAAGVPVAEGVLRDAARTPLRDHAMAPPYVAKPVAEGSSVGVVIVRAGANRPPEAIRTIPVTREGQIMVERFIAGRELTCAVIGDAATDIIDIVAAGPSALLRLRGEVRPRRLEAHAAGATFPTTMSDAPSSATRWRPIRRSAAAACRARISAGTRPTGELVFLEINTQPGMTPTSLVPELAAACRA